VRNGSEVDETTQQAEFGLFTTEAQISCRRCEKQFNSNNKLHKHLRDGCDGRKAAASNTLPHKELTTTKPDNGFSNVSKQIVIQSSVTRDETTDHDPVQAFRTWKYAIAKVGFADKAPLEEVCVDSGCTMSIIDRKFLKRVLPNATPTKVESVPVRGIGKTVQQCDQHVTFELYLPGKEAMAVIRCGARVVEDLKANFLIGMDILGPERIDLILSQSLIIIGSYQRIKIPIKTRARGNKRVKRIVKAKSRILIPPRLSVKIPITVRGKISIPTDRNYLLSPADINMGIRGGVIVSVVDANTAFVMVRNTINRSVTVSRNQRLGIAQKYTAEGCYRVAVAEDMHALTTGPISWAKRLLIQKDRLAVQSNGAHTGADEAKAEVTGGESEGIG
jgi:hypothetical protein